MDNQLKSLFNEEEWSFLSKNFPKAANVVEQLPLVEKPNEERMKEAHDSLAESTSD